MRLAETERGSGQQGAVRSDGPLLHPRGLTWGRTARVALSVGTAVWLIVQIFAGLTFRDGAWPITSYPMFSGVPTEMTKWQLHGLTAGGEMIEWRAEDFGLTYSQFKGYLFENVEGLEGEYRPQRYKAVAELVRQWDSERPTGQHAERVIVEQRVQRAPVAEHSEQSRVVLEWPAP